MNKTLLDWKDVEAMVRRLIDRIGDVGRFDLMLVITRGGMVPACLVSEWTGLRDILVAAVMFYRGVGQTMDKPVFLQFPPDPYLKDRRILVVDDIWDSGRTIMAVRARVEAAGGIPETAVLHYKPARSRFPGHRPDYYVEETDAWVVYPWEPEDEGEAGRP
ncbi:MAG TPA: phosphoribosyltransferase family protein [Bacillota bacterium]